MAVYIIGQITISDRSQYSQYEKNFMEVFNLFDGTLLSVDDNPTILEGSWSATRSVLISFPSSEAAAAWYKSEAYQAIAKDRYESSTANSIMVIGLDEMMKQSSS